MVRLRSLVLHWCSGLGARIEPAMGMPKRPCFYFVGYRHDGQAINLENSNLLLGIADWIGGEITILVAILLRRRGSIFVFCGLNLFWPSKGWRGGRIVTFHVAMQASGRFGVDQGGVSIDFFADRGQLGIVLFQFLAGVNMVVV